MAPTVRTILRFLAHILALELLFRGGWAQFSPCPANATSCCQCITTPGCSWYYGPMDSTAERLPRCRPLALVAERPESYSQNFLTPPGLVNILDIPQRLNRPINPQRMRLLRPQTARVTIGLGMRRLVPIQVMAQSRRIRLRVIGPHDAPEFTLQRGDSLSCIHRFRVRDRGGSDLAARAPRREGRRREGRRRGGRNSRRNSQLKQLHVDCYVSAPGDIQNLNLVVDMNRCYAGEKTIRVMLRQRGTKRTKVEIKSACSCPCQSEDGEVVPGQDGLCPAEEREQTCISVDEHGADSNECSGANNYCQRGENEPVCSGHGICICSVCMCNVLPGQATPNVLPNGSQPIQERYRGWYCQCDNTACPWSDGVICGGPSRGICECGMCHCAESFRGEACDRTTSVENCMEMSNGSVCSDHGNCVDGACVCEEPFSGALCEVCNTCPASCSTFRPCVECLLLPHHRGPQPNCAPLCTAPNATITISATSDEWPNSCEVCTFQANNCFYEYAYSSRFDDGGYHVSLFYRPAPSCIDPHEDM